MDKHTRHSLKSLHVCSTDSRIGLEQHECEYVTVFLFLSEMSLLVGRIFILFLPLPVY